MDLTCQCIPTWDNEAEGSGHRRDGAATTPGAAMSPLTFPSPVGNTPVSAASRSGPSHQLLLPRAQNAANEPPCNVFRGHNLLAGHA